MIGSALRLTVVALLLVPASAGAGGTRPSVALTASPSRVALTGTDRATVRVTNTGGNRVVVDAERAGFALDLRGRPRIVSAEGNARSATRWITMRPRSFALAPGKSASVTIASKLPAAAEPGDHDALAVLTTRRRVQDGVAVRMRIGILVVVRAPGTVVRLLELRSMRAVGRGRLRVLELLVVNKGNVTESVTRARAAVSLFQRGRRVARLSAEPRQFRPRTSGILQFRYRGPVRGWVTVHADVAPDVPGVAPAGRAFRIRL